MRNQILPPARLIIVITLVWIVVNILLQEKENNRSVRSLLIWLGPQHMRSDVQQTVWLPEVLHTIS